LKFVDVSKGKIFLRLSIHEKNPKLSQRIPRKEYERASFSVLKKLNSKGTLPFFFLL